MSAAMQPIVRHEPAPTTAGPAPRDPARPGLSPVGAGSPASAVVAAASLSLRWVVPGVAAAVLAGALLFAGATWERDSRNVLVGEVEARLVLEARHLALVSGGALLDPYPELTLQPLLQNLLRDRPDLESAVVLDRSGVVKGHPLTDHLGKPYAAPPTLARVAPRAALGDGEMLRGDAQRLVAEAPVRVGSGERIGTAVVSLRRAWLDGLAEQARRRRVAVTWMLLAGGTLVMLAAIALLLRPVSVLRRGIERLGRGDLQTPIRLRDRTEFGMLAGTLNQMAVELLEAQRASVERERLAREMELARDLQRSLLPARRHEAGDCALVGAQLAAAEVGGDYFDIVPLENGRLGFAIADVAGKGIGGCLIMTMLSALLRGFRDRYDSPAALLAAIDRSLSGSLPRGGFVTMTYGTLDAASGRVALASAGHLPAIVFRAAGASIEWRRAKAPPVGALRKGGIEKLLHDDEFVLGPGDLLVQITDGYHEAPARESGEQFEFTRIEAIVRRHGPEGPEAVIRALDEAVRSWTSGPARDDQTILVVARGTAAVPAAAAAPEVAPDLAEPLALLHRLEREGGGLRLEPRLEELARIRGWLRERAARPLDPDAERAIVCALYEACANAIEHGLAGRLPTPVDVWWVSPGAPEGSGDDAVFVIRDRGAPFDLTTPRASDFDDPQVRRRGRGLGLAMIQRVTNRLAYAGGTPEGNVTVLRFDPRPAAA